MSIGAVEQDTAAIRRLVDDVQAKQSDVEPFLALHTDDTVVVNFGGRRVAGKDALRRAMTTGLASPLAKVTTTAELQGIRFVRPDVAIVSATKNVTDDRDGRLLGAEALSVGRAAARLITAGWRPCSAVLGPLG